MTGGWIFAYAEALRRVGIRTVIICFSSRIRSPEQCTHGPTGAVIRFLPATFMYRAARQPFQNPYAWSIEEAFGDWDHASFAVRVSREILKDGLPYLATPLFRLASALRNEGCGAMLCQEYEYARFDVCVALGRLLSIPVFATFQGGNWQASRFERHLRPSAIRNCAGLIIGPQTELRRVQDTYGLNQEKLARIFNPVDTMVWRPCDREEARSALRIPSNAEVVAWHGRVDMHRKGLDILLRAWARLHEERSSRDLRLLLIGTGNDADKLSTMIKELRLAGVSWNNSFLQEPDLLRTYLSSADVYAFPSRHEGFPMAPLEAMACGLPIAATDAPGIPDILEFGANSGGYLVPRENVQALAGALGRLLDDRTQRHQLGLRARQRIEENFSMEAVGAQLFQFLSSRGCGATKHDQSQSSG